MVIWNQQKLWLWMFCWFWFAAPNTPWISPKLDHSLLAARVSSWKLTSAVDEDCNWHSSTLRFSDFLTLFQLFGVAKCQSAGIMNKMSNWTFRPIYGFMNTSKLVKTLPEKSLLPDILPPLNTNNICGWVTRLTTLKHACYFSYHHYLCYNLCLNQNNNLHSLLCSCKT